MLDINDINKIFSSAEEIATDKTLIGKTGQKFSAGFKKLASVIKKKFNDVVLSKLNSSKPVEKFYKEFTDIQNKIIDKHDNGDVKIKLERYYKYGIDHPELQSFILAGVTFAYSRLVAMTGLNSPLGPALMKLVFKSIDNSLANKIQDEPQQLSEVDLKNIIKNISTKVTKDKLLKSWKKAGSPKDENSIIDILIKAGLNNQQLKTLSQKTGFKLTPPEGKGMTAPMGQLGLSLKNKEDDQDQMELPIGKGYQPAYPEGQLGQLNLPLNPPSQQTELPFRRGFKKSEPKSVAPIVPSFRTSSSQGNVPPVIPPPVIKPPIIPTPKTRIPPVIGTPPTLPTAVPKKPNILQKAWQGLSDLSKQSNKKMAQQQSQIPSTFTTPTTQDVKPKPEYKPFNPSKLVRMDKKSLDMYNNPTPSKVITSPGNVIAAARPTPTPKVSVPAVTPIKKIKSKKPISKKPESPFRGFVKTYPLKENITKEQLKSLIKEVKRVVDEQDI